MFQCFIELVDKKIYGIKIIVKILLHSSLDV